jgi:hypothetical protein
VSRRYPVAGRLAELRQHQQAIAGLLDGAVRVALAGDGLQASVVVDVKMVRDGARVLEKMAEALLRDLEVGPS